MFARTRSARSGCVRRSNIHSHAEAHTPYTACAALFRSRSLLLVYCRLWCTPMLVHIRSLSLFLSLSFSYITCERRCSTLCVAYDDWHVKAYQSIPVKGSESAHQYSVLLQRIRTIRYLLISLLIDRDTSLASSTCSSQPWVPVDSIHANDIGIYHIYLADRNNTAAIRLASASKTHCPMVCCLRSGQIK